MVITSARLQNYRIYQDSSFEFDPGVNIIVGPNASGKTNLLDAIYFCASGFQLVKAKDQTIMSGKNWARVDCLTNTSQTRIIKVKENTEIVIDGKIYKRLPQKEKIPTVIFEPKHLYSITTSPEMRRGYLDDILTGVSQDFVKIRSGYQKTLRQRNSLLKTGSMNVKKQVFAWDIRLSELAGEYVDHRIRLIDRINKQTSEIYSAIASKKHNLTINYETNTAKNNYADNMLANLQKNIEIDLIRGFTGTGPHRDDISLVLDDNDIRERASRGETRSTLLTLKIIEAK
ncbi:DNA replication and repair protein RecF, partial [Candidatus Saccharibacteria bacterium]|nr:DNA replication and repair protein RecF [Candidatus Saccharibacteria bacterium]